ncbi:MAG: CAP domain-containing protein [Candidatus Bathyarchaeota archaeon]|nr:CAP domain-containing protein [Candidatus Bathyarchaeota archaeon]
MESEGEFHFKKKTPFSNKTEKRLYQTARRKRRIPVGKTVSVVTGIVGFLIIGLIIGFIFCGLGGLITSSISISQTEDEIFKGINEQRASMGLPILGNNSALVSISNSWSNQLATMGTLTHGDFEGRIASIGYSYYSCGEIIGSFTSGSINGVPTTDSPSELAREFVDMWLNSPPHREIMLTASSGFMGVGLSRNGSTFYAVVDFRFG